MTVHEKKLKRLLFLIIIAVLSYGFSQHRDIFLPEVVSSPGSTDAILQRAYNNRQSDLQVQGKGIVTKILNDDLEGSRHQRFIVHLRSKQALLIAHNIDLAPRIMNLRIGDAVEFHGEYEWNNKGGVIHWTHHDPAGRHQDGWLKHAGRMYE